jgi:L-cysteine desulfidase
MSKSKKKPGSIYAINHGKHERAFFVLIEENKDHYSFLSLPELTVENVPIDEVNTGLKKEILDFIEILPRDVFKICLNQYRKNKNASADTRRIQSPIQDILGMEG